jgi:hypothetical protein
MTTQLANYDDPCRAIALCFTKDEAKEIKDKAIAAYAKQMNNKEAQIQWVSVATRVERRWGHIYAESEKAKGGGTGAHQHRAASAEQEPAATPTLAEMGVSKKASSRAQKLTAIPGRNRQIQWTEVSIRRDSGKGADQVWRAELGAAEGRRKAK